MELHRDSAAEEEVWSEAKKKDQILLHKRLVMASEEA